MSPPGHPAPPADTVLGRQEPTQKVIAPYEWTEGPRCIEFCHEIAGMDLDPWQQLVLVDGMGIQADGLWSTFELELSCSRRNGKSVILEARSLYGLFVLRERKIVWSTHRNDAAMESFWRVVGLIEGSPSLKREIPPRGGIITSNGKESITLKSGQQMLFKTRIDGGGKGLDGDLCIIDEDQNAQPSHLASLMPIIGARPNPTIWYAGSAGGPNSVVKGSLVHRALKSDKPEDRERLTLFGWAADEDDDPSLPATWAKANPALGRRLLLPTMAGFYRSMRYMPENFAGEHLGIGNYPRPAGEEWVVPAAAWSRCEDLESEAIGTLVLAADAKPDRSWASLGIAGWRADGAVHGELVAHERGVRWIPERIAQLLEDHDLEEEVAIDPKGPLGYLVPDLKDIGIRVRLLEPADVTDAYAWFTSTAGEEPPAVDENDDSDWQPGFRHRGQVPLTAALAAASSRSIGDREAFSRRGSVDISPITAVAFAGLVLVQLGRTPPPPPPPRAAPGDSNAGGALTDDLMTKDF